MPKTRRRSTSRKPLVRRLRPALLLGLRGDPLLRRTAVSDPETGRKLQAAAPLVWQNDPRRTPDGCETLRLLGHQSSRLRTLPGIAPHPWTGFSQFKRAFGGKGRRGVPARGSGRSIPRYGLLSHRRPRSADESATPKGARTWDEFVVRNPDGGRSSRPRAGAKGSSARTGGRRRYLLSRGWSSRSRCSCCAIICRRARRPLDMFPKGPGVAPGVCNCPRCSTVFAPHPDPLSRSR